jgi:hypothetical protein
MAGIMLLFYHRMEGASKGYIKGEMLAGSFVWTHFGAADATERIPPLGKHIFFS